MIESSSLGTLGVCFPAPLSSRFISLRPCDEFLWWRTTRWASTAYGVCVASCLSRGDIHVWLSTITWADDTVKYCLAFSWTCFCLTLGRLGQHIELIESSGRGTFFPFFLVAQEEARASEGTREEKTTKTKKKKKKETTTSPSAILAFSGEQYLARIPFND